MKDSPPKSRPADPRREEVSVAHWAGPLPPPATLEQFERIVPGAAQRLLAMAETEQKHRHAIESGQLALQQEGVRLAARDSKLGILASFLGLLASLGTGLTAFLMGASWPVVIAFVGPAIMMVLAELARLGKR
ncbi:MAG: DUF2335 domain-containing protein [Tepidimonas sp.]|nr:DUF2335 domain-containing protein [Tepidimonas sp.]